MRARSAVGEIALWIAAGVGLISIVGAVAIGVFHVKPLVFSSNSMAPAIPVGSLAIARERPADELAVGDVVSVVQPGGARVTHRIEALTRTTDGQAELTLRGDANSVADQQTYLVAAADVVDWSVPWFGKAVVTLQSKPVVLAVGIVLGAWWGWWIAARPGRTPSGSDEPGVEATNSAGATRTP